MKRSNNQLEETTMHFLQRYTCYAALIGFGAANGLYGQVSSINSAVVQPRVFNDVPGATLTVVTNYPSSISFNEQGVSAASGFANRDAWKFSSTSGASAYQFQNNDYFSVMMTLTLTGSPISPRKEAGFLLSTASHGDLQFIVNTDGHEVVQFGGVGFYSFNVSNGILYNSGDTIRLGMTYFLDANGKNAFIFSANGVDSPVDEFATVGDGIGNGSTLGGYFQIVNDSANAANAGSALFQNISISGVVPEPSTFALLSLGIVPMGLLLRRRCRG